MRKTIINKTEKAYLQVARIIEQRLIAGKEDILPSYRDLAAEYNVSLNIVQRAFQELRKTNVVIPRQGKRVKATVLKDHQRIMYRYGFIHPFNTDYSFGQALVYYVNEAFSSPDLNVSIAVRSSNGKPKLEREIAENMLYNGIQGILVSPADINHNSSFFAELAKKIPVVVIDQVFPDISLPGVIIDYAECGRQIGQRLIHLAGSGDALMIFDREMNRSAQDFIGEAKSTMQQHGYNRFHTLIVPALHALRKSIRGDYTEINKLRNEFAAFLSTHNINAIFCYYDTFADVMLLEDGWFDNYPKVKLILQCGNKIQYHSRHYFSNRVIRYEVSYNELFRKAAALMVRWEHSSRKPRGITRIKFCSVPRYKSKSGNQNNIV